MTVQGTKRRRCATWRGCATSVAVVRTTCSDRLLATEGGVTVSGEFVVAEIELGGMGVFQDKGVLYKPVDEVDLGQDSDEIYRRSNVKAPRMAGFLVKVFSWFLESPIFGGILLFFLKRNNLIHK
ncbi:hypothetical protein OROMI_024138 [Orobanche minor]